MGFLRQQGLARSAAWAISLVVHACFGVVCCVAPGSSPLGPELAASEPPLVFEVALVSVAESHTIPPAPADEAEPPLPELPEPETLLPEDTPEPEAPTQETVAQEAILPPEPHPPPAWDFSAIIPPGVPLELAAASAPMAEGPLPAAPSLPVVAPAGAPASEVAPPGVGATPVVAASTPAGPTVASEPPAPMGSPEARAERGGRPGVGASPVRRAASAPPAYPALARRHGYEGLVVLSVRVSRDGRPLSVSVKQSSGHSVLDEAALAAVRAWRFEPATLNGAPVEAEVEVPIRFKLTD